jgi:alpha-glucosidase
MKFPSRSCHCQSRKILVPLPLASITQRTHFLSPSFAHPPRKSSFRPTNSPIIFEPQYLRIKTSIPANANIYGLGEHSNTFRIPTDNTTLTLWSRDAFGLPTGTNLYGAHPVYFEHRPTGTHGVFFRNSNGMDVKITKNGPGGPALEYNVIGGVIDLYFPCRKRN